MDKCCKNGPLVALQLGKERALGLENPLLEVPSVPMDWEHTAALVESLELVISVDTAMAHLAGALGVPTLLLLNSQCDWRWGQTEESTVDWYESITIPLHRVQ